MARRETGFLFDSIQLFLFSRGTRDRKWKKQIMTESGLSDELRGRTRRSRVSKLESERLHQRLPNPPSPGLARQNMRGVTVFVVPITSQKDHIPRRRARNRRSLKRLKDHGRKIAKYLPGPSAYQYVRVIKG